MNVGTRAVYGSLQKAIGKAAPGRTLRITGTCTGSFTIPKPLLLQRGDAAAVLKGHGDTVLRVSGSGVTLIGLRIVGGTATACPTTGPGWVCGGGIHNTGVLTLIKTVVAGNTAPGGSGSSLGGGIYNDENATLSLTLSTVSDNRATTDFSEADGAGIANAGTLHLDRSTISRNSASGEGDVYGGGIFEYQTTGLVIVASTISGNTMDAPGRAWGGGLYVDKGSVVIRNSTIAGNSVTGGGDQGRGGGIFESGAEMAISASTIASNRVTAPTGMGGGIWTNGAPTVRASIIAGNTADTGRDCTMDDPASSEGDNLIGSGASCLGFQDGQKGDQVGTNNAPVDARLATLASNGGPTKTRALRAGSPAINAGPPSMCATGKDQRGVKRPQGGGCDLGAYEKD